jgi:hypothetical protein
LLNWDYANPYNQLQKLFGVIIKKPIFLLAPARSGTTVFYNLFTRQPDTGFPEHYIDKYWNSSFMISLVPTLVKIQQIRYKQRSLPHEGVFWRKFHNYNQVLTENDVNKEHVKFFKKIMSTQLKAFNAKRFVARSHDFCLRIKYLNKIFPDAYYIILNRDPKAVVCSQYTLMKKDWDPIAGANTYGSTIEKFKTNQSKLETCINYYKFYIDTMNKDLKLIKNKCEINYEEFVKDPKHELKKLFNFVELEWNNELDKSIPKVLELKNNEKWKLLPKNEQEVLQKTFS